MFSVTPELESAVLVANLRATRAAAEAVRSAVGVRGLLRVAWRCAVLACRGAPFGMLGAPRGERERLARAQAGGLLLLDRGLAPEMGRKARRDLLAKVVREGGIAFLERMIPLRPSAPALLAARFFNAIGTTHTLLDGTFAFDVRRCLFVELCVRTSQPHLASLFCEVDFAFFGARRAVVLRRTKTLATGGGTCDFRFHLPNE